MESFLLGPDKSKIVSGFNNYGCWCVLEGDKRVASNDDVQPVSMIDAFCLILKVEYQNIKASFQNNHNQTDFKNKECDPYQTNYKNKGFAVKRNNYPYMKFQMDVCENLNKGNFCAVQVCKAEMSFVKSLHDYIFFEESDDRDIYKHDNGFNTTLHC